jgi:hypothetical protein
MCVKSSNRCIVESLNRIADVTVHDSRCNKADRAQQDSRKTSEEKEISQERRLQPAAAWFAAVAAA